MPGPGPCRPGVLGQGDLDSPYVDRLRTLVTGLGLVLHARALGERAVALGFDAAVMDEEVLVAFIGSDEAKALLVAEPLDGTCCHVFLHGVSSCFAAVVATEQPSASACTAFAAPSRPAELGARYHVNRAHNHSLEDSVHVLVSRR